MTFTSIPLIPGQKSPFWSLSSSANGNILHSGHCERPEAHLTDKVVTIELKFPPGVVSLEGDAVKDLVDRVVGPDDANIPDDPGREVKVLPRPAMIL